MLHLQLCGTKNSLELSLSTLLLLRRRNRPSNKFNNIPGAKFILRSMVYLSRLAVSPVSRRGVRWGARGSTRRVLQGDRINAPQGSKAIDLPGKNHAKKM